MSPHVPSRAATDDRRARNDVWVLFEHAHRQQRRLLSLVGGLLEIVLCRRQIRFRFGPRITHGLRLGLQLIGGRVLVVQGLAQLLNLLLHFRGLSAGPAEARRRSTGPTADYNAPSAGPAGATGSAEHHESAPARVRVPLKLLHFL